MLTNDLLKKQKTFDGGAVRIARSYITAPSKSEQVEARDPTAPGGCGTGPIRFRKKNGKRT